MDRKQKPLAAPLWNWADPSGYGVPGKPITPEQFYTEEVFAMLVPDDGLGLYQQDGRQMRVANSPGYRGPQFRRPDPPLKEGEGMELWGPRHDPGIFADPGGDIDPGIHAPTPYDPASDPWCEQYAQAFHDNYHKLAAELAEARAMLASAQTSQDKAGWEREVRTLERALADARPGYERALKCKGQVEA